MRGQEVAYALRFGLKTLDTAALPGFVHLASLALLVALAMGLDHPADGAFHACCVVRQLGVAAAALLGGVTG